MVPDPEIIQDPVDMQDISQGHTMAAGISGLASQPSSSLSGDSEEIHHDNLTKLSQMSETEILEEQRKLQAMLGKNCAQY